MVPDQSNGLFNEKHKNPLARFVHVHIAIDLVSPFNSKTRYSSSTSQFCSSHSKQGPTLNNHPSERSPVGKYYHLGGCCKMMVIHDR